MVKLSSANTFFYHYLILYQADLRLTILSPYGTYSVLQSSNLTIDDYKVLSTSLASTVVTKGIRVSFESYRSYCTQLLCNV